MLTWAATASRNGVVSGTPGRQTGSVIGSHHDGTLIASSNSLTLHVVPAATTLFCPLGEICVPSMRRQIWLSFAAAAGLVKMKRCSSAKDFSTPLHMLMF